MENKFFTFIKPYLNYIDNGHLYRKPFSWLYVLLAIINLIAPLYVFYMAVDNNIFESPAKFIISFLLVWIVVAFAGWVSFQLWLDRRTKVKATSAEGDDFVATPVFSHLIQTYGEWIGTWIGIVGFFISLFTTIILGDEANFLSYQIGLPFMESGIEFIVLFPIIGFLIIVFTRFLAEQFRALSSIANNTRKN